MTEKNRNLLLRVLSAVVLLPVVLFLLSKGGFYTAGLLGAAAAACTYEYLSITLKKLVPVSWGAVAVSAAMPSFETKSAIAMPMQSQSENFRFTGSFS